MSFVVNDRFFTESDNQLSPPLIDENEYNNSLFIPNFNYENESRNGIDYSINFNETNKITHEGKNHKENGQDTQESTKNSKKEKKTLFKIKNKNLGRKRKDGTDTKKGNHNSKALDNIRRRIKNDTKKYILKRINELIKKSNIGGKWKMKKIKPNIINSINQDDKHEKSIILKLLDTKVKDIFSTEIPNYNPKANKKFDKDYNKNLIELLINNYDKKKMSNASSEIDEQIYDFLNSTFEKMLNKYAEDFNEIQKNLEQKDDEEKKIYIDYLKNYRENIFNIEPRKIKK